MRIGVFAYNFEHWKTQAGIHNLMLAGYKPEVIFAADWKQLTAYRSKIRTAPCDLYLNHPKTIAALYDIDYHVAPHNSPAVASLIKEYDLDLGVVLGARILKPASFVNFRKGVLNMHPGILPFNRGLDNIKWAIMKSLPQGVTTHLIDEKIDRGLLVESETIQIYKDDTIMDLQIRVQNLEQKKMISSIALLANIQIEQLSPLQKGAYHNAMPPDVEKHLIQYMEQYTKKWSNK